MKEIIVRICSWYSLIIYSITSLISLLTLLIEKIDVGIIFVFLMCFSLSFTGWNARKYGLPNYRINRYSKLTAIVSLIFGIISIVIIPILLTSLPDSNDNYLVTLILAILFSPIVISSIAILSTKSENTILTSNKYDTLN
jgi:hypothetical protein